MFTICAFRNKVRVNCSGAGELVQIKDPSCITAGGTFFYFIDVQRTSNINCISIRPFLPYQGLHVNVVLLLLACLLSHIR